MTPADSFTRRDALKTLGAGAALLGLSSLSGTAFGADQAPGTVSAPQPFTLPKLGYAYDALEPQIDARTMEIHHTKHHQAYITNVNNALKDKPDLANKSVEDLIKDLSAAP